MKKCDKCGAELLCTSCKWFGEATNCLNKKRTKSVIAYTVWNRQCDLHEFKQDKENKQQN